MVMRVRCVCGHDKPHGQICWLRTELEIPFDNNDEHYIEMDALQRQIPVCRSCIKRYVQARIKKDGKNGTDTAGAKMLLEILPKSKLMDLIADETNPLALDFVCLLLHDLRGPEGLNELLALMKGKIEDEAVS